MPCNCQGAQWTPQGQAAPADGAASIAPPQQPMARDYFWSGTPAEAPEAVTASASTDDQ